MLVVAPESPPTRVDRLAADLSGLSRSHVQRLISEGRLTLDGQALRANAIVGGGVELQLSIPAAAPAAPTPRPDIAVEVVYEDDDLLIVDKPWGSSSIRRRGTPRTRS